MPHWFEPLADHMGPAYLRYSFTKGTRQEVDFLVEALDLRPPMRVLDVGCGPGRHAHELARRGVSVVGVDISARFCAQVAAEAPPGCAVVRADAGRLPLRGGFDAAISLCQGGFGLSGPEEAAGSVLDADLGVLRAVRDALRPGGRVAVSAFSAYFQVRWLESADAFDAASGVNHERTEVRDDEGVAVPADLWTTCFTPRELRLLAERAGLEAQDVWSVAPGDYRRRPPSVETPEFLLVARRR